MSHILQVKNLTIDYRQGKEKTRAVDNVSFSIEEGKTMGLVGKSGCGKSTVALSLLGLLPKEESDIPNGEILLKDQNLLNLDSNGWRSVRGKKIAMIFQDPFSSLNPVLTIDYQLQEAIELSNGSPSDQRANDLLSLVQLKDTHRILSSYPHQLSGGQRQRVMIAMALAQNPEFLVADEPTTALDVTVQADIMKLLKKLQKELKMSMLFITHNMGLVKEIADELGVMFRGKLVEQGKTMEILKNPRHAYTQGLLKCIPKLHPDQGPIPVLDEAFLEE